MPWSILAEVALVVDQVRVTDWPLVIEDTLAEKLAVGAVEAGGVVVPPPPPEPTGEPLAADVAADSALVALTALTLK